LKKNRELLKKNQENVKAFFYFAKAYPKKEFFVNPIALIARMS